MIFKSRQRALCSYFESVRRITEKICAPLLSEDTVIQSSPEVSPPKWHLAHTTWFFETFVVAKFRPRYEPFCPQYHYLFNSYYESLGGHLEKGRRGFLCRPTLEEVYLYRKDINEKTKEIIDSVAVGAQDRFESLSELVTLGIHHEQQHQELLLMDIKHIYWSNPLRPKYLRELNTQIPEPYAPNSAWLEYQGGLKEFGVPEEKDSLEFAFDNEGPRHKAYLENYSVASRLVTAGEYLEFIEARGYDDPKYWLSDGFAAAKRLEWHAPLYWEKSGSRWQQMTLLGMKPLDEAAPVSHLSFYEADAFARFKAMRLPTEYEWENAVKGRAVEGNFFELGLFRENSSQDGSQFFGNLWEWTASPYQPYPGFSPWQGPIGEYNGKFMANQFVLRGGSYGTSITHIRPTYRNYYSPESRWAFTGMRLAK